MISGIDDQSWCRCAFIALVGLGRRCTFIQTAVAGVAFLLAVASDIGFLRLVNVTACIADTYDGVAPG